MRGVVFSSAWVYWLCQKSPFRVYTVLNTFRGSHHSSLVQSSHLYSVHILLQFSKQLIHTMDKVENKTVNPKICFATLSWLCTHNKYMFLISLIRLTCRSIYLVFVILQTHRVSVLQRTSAHYSVGSRLTDGATCMSLIHIIIKKSPWQIFLWITSIGCVSIRVVSSTG